MYRTILFIIIILSVMIFGYFVWPTPYQYTHTVQNILVRINRLTGETCYFIPGKGWEKISEEKSTTKNNDSDSSGKRSLIELTLPQEEQNDKKSSNSEKKFKIESLIPDEKQSEIEP